ncbi:MAG: citrate (Si)-synthase [Chlamydiales bacterium]
MTDVLFEITAEHLETGLRGIPVGYCTTSKVDPEKGLFYREYPISDLAFWEPERVIYLLYYGTEPQVEELKVFKAELQKRGYCHSSVLKHIEALPKEGHPMALFSAAILILGMFVLTGDWKEDCLNVIATAPIIAAAVINAHAGWGKTPASKPELGYMENFAHMLKAPNMGGEDWIQLLKLYNILHFDHGGGNLSTFVGKTVASGLEDMYGSLASAMNALAGPRHGRANQECLHFVEEMLRDLGPGASEIKVESHIRNKLEKNELVYGFGHAVLRVEDPRATILYELGKEKFSQNALLQLALCIRSGGSKVLKENPKISNPYPNVDAISGTLLTAAGFSYPEYYTVLFGLSRIVGIAIQIVYERCIAREGKGTPIVRPKYIYKKI